MSKSKRRPSSTVESTTPEAVPVTNSTAAPAPALAPATLPLHAEIAAFLARREELSRKVAEEIAATELKLAELRQTAALLVAESKEQPAKDRKPKKLKLKSVSPAGREEKPAAESPVEAVA